MNDDGEEEGRMEAALEAIISIDSNNSSINISISSRGRET